MRRSNNSAFTLIEVAVAVAVIAILAGAAAPLVLRALNQQREQKTRENLKTAWEAMFGARDRRVANMLADFGFNPPIPSPPGSVYNLGKMLLSTAAPGPNPPANYGLNGGIFNWGWNGPYWNGSTRNVGGVLVPIDGWGNAMLLRYVNGGPYQGFQILSVGANGSNNSSGLSYIPQGDDIVYPDVPLPVFTAASISLSIKNDRASAITGTYQVRWRDGNGVLNNPTPTPLSIAAGESIAPSISNILPGPIQIQINITSGTAINSEEVVDLMPGESRALNYDFR
jgi:prepilin-type N-terminal cleavage/methylation domain-containing protein